MNTPSSIAEDPATAPTTSQVSETAAGAPESAGGAADAGRPTGDKLQAYREAFLLNQLLHAMPHHKMAKGDANKTLGAPAKKHLGLTPKVANRLRTELAARQYLRVQKKGQKVTYELTDEGREYLQTLEPYPFPSRHAGIAAIPENLREYVKPYLLLHLLKLQAEEPSVRMGEANRFDALGKTHLKLTPGIAREIWSEMQHEGLVHLVPQGRTVTCELLPAGRAYLANHDHYAAYDYKLPGKILNELLHARTAARGEEAPQPARSFAPRPADLSAAAFAEFEELRREEYGHTGLVPIHRIRERIAAKYGSEAARHDTLDAAIRQLWGQGRVRPIGLADLQKATPEQLNASIPGVNETLFYLEHANG